MDHQSFLHHFQKGVIFSVGIRTFILLDNISTLVLLDHISTLILLDQFQGSNYFLVN